VPAPGAGRGVGTAQRLRRGLCTAGHDPTRLQDLLRSRPPKCSKPAAPPQTLLQTSWGPETYRAINANTPQPKYSRVYATYRPGSEVSWARTSAANSSLGFASSHRRMVSHLAASYLSQLS